MATPSQPSNPSNPPGQSINPNLFKQSLKDLLEDQGDYNNLLKDSIKMMGSLDASYTRILSRIDSLNKDTINVRELNRELNKLSQKQYITEKNRNENK